ncbi:MAG: 16S rRNA processing protein RimM, partial [Clostridia bacterium]|nr:16S rRNA processing protein RimM [Clostridia bacterium]
MLKEFIEVGKIVGTHGVRGALRVQPWCDSADFLVGFNYLYLTPNGDVSFKCTRCAAQKNIILLWLDGIDTVEKASELRGKVVYVNRKD